MNKFVLCSLSFVFFTLGIGSSFADPSKNLDIEISKLDSKLFKFPSQLEEINILAACGRNVKSDIPIPAQIVTLQNLRVLRIGQEGRQDCDLNTSLPDGFGKLKNLRVLSVDYSLKKRGVFPREIGELKNLEELRFTRQDLKAFPPELRNLKKLKMLNLSMNEIKTVPDWIGELDGLLRLDLSFNNIKVLPDSIKKLKHLSIVILGNNSLKKKEQKKMIENFPSIMIDFGNEYEDSSRNEE